MTLTSPVSLTEIPQNNLYKKGDVFVLFGELFGRGYVTGLLDQAKKAGMEIIGITVGRRDENNRLRPLTEEELAVYVGEYGRNSFQVGLNWYRAGTNPEFAAKLSEHHGKRIDIPSLFIAGAADWGVRQKPGDFENMQSSACSDFRGAHLIDGAGHWVQQEQPEETNRLILNFLQSL